MKALEMFNRFAARCRRKVGLSLQGIGGRYGVSENDYDARRYWNEHHAIHGHASLQGVGHSSLTPKANDSWYRSGRYIFSGMVSELKLPSTARVLEFGFGTGFYTKIIHELGFRDYVGVDIANIQEPQVRQDIPQFRGRLVGADAGADTVRHLDCQLIYSIDMTQHIVNTEKLTFMLTENVLPNLAAGGVFIVTDALMNRKFEFNEHSRSLAFYSKALGLPILHEPILFRDKYIFSFKKA